MLTLPIPALLSDQVKIWLVYSGNRRKFFNEFIEHSAVFLDLPGFAPAEQTFQDIPRLRQHLRMSDAIRSYYQGHLGDHPGRRVNVFSSAASDTRTPEGRRFNAEIGNALRMYQEAQVGDLVLSPPIGHYDPFLVGTIASPWSPDDLAYSRLYSEDPVPFRRVNWLHDSVSRRDFPRKIAKSLQNPHAISIVERDLYFDIFFTCFESFIWGGRSKLNIYGNAYSSNDPLETYEAAFIIKYFAAAYAAYVSGNIDNFNALEPGAAVASYYDPGLFLEFRQNFNSPGKFALAAAAAAMALCIGAGITVISDAQPANVNVPQVSALIQTSVAPVNPAVARTVDGFVQSLSPERVDQMNREYGHHAREKIGISLKRTEVAAEAGE